MKQIFLSTLSTVTLVVSFNSSFAQDLMKLKNGNELKVKVQEITPEEVKYKRFDNLDGPLFTIFRNTVQSIKYENGTKEILDEYSSNDAVQPSRSTSFAQSPSAFEIGDVVKFQYHFTSHKGIVKEISRNRKSALIELERKDKKVEINRNFNELTLVEKIKNGNSSQLVQGIDNTQSYVASTPVTQNQFNGSSYADLFLQGQLDAKRYYQGYHGAGTGTFLTTFFIGPIVGLIPAIACSSTAPKQDRLGFPNNQLSQNANYYSGYTQEARRIKSKKVWGNFGIATGILFGIVVIASVTSR